MIPFKRKGYQTIHRRLFLLFLFGAASSLLVLSLLFYNRTSEQFQRKIGDLAEKNIAQTVGLFDLMFGGYDSLSKSLVNNFELARLLHEPSREPAVQFINEQSITTILGAIFYSRRDVIGIHVITDKGKIYNYGNSMNVVDPDYRERDWYKQIHSSSGQMVWLGVHPRSLIDEAETRPVFAFGRQIYDLNEHKPIAVALYETEPGPVLDALDNLKLGAHSQVYLLDKDNLVLSSTVLGAAGFEAATPNASPSPFPLAETAIPAASPVNPPFPYPLEASDSVTVQRGKEHLLVASRLPFADWSVASVTPNRDLNVELVEMKRYLYLVVSILIAVSALIGSAVSLTISKPIKQLIREMKLVEIGNFRRVKATGSYQEIRILVGSFNAMVLRIEELIERVKISSVSEKNAELQALQSQVNPHFLYNTLDMIYWMLDEKGNDRLGDIVLSLSHLFRYSSHWEEGAAVTLAEEVEQMRHYLTIITARLEGRLTVEIDIDERWMNVPLPRMTLQPIIENAVKHGLEALNDRPGFLRVSAQAERQALLIRMEDNGEGMSGEQLARLTDALRHPSPSGAAQGGIGLQNLQLRLIHMFGEGYGLCVESAPGEGTTVFVRLPLSGKGDGNP
ncbi:cache domain-containing sensor histidine kinase [Gorillibacterium sp. sgz500922]|uniref:cache domain-containing sensor histidine kinase n=1 Tax=Gorillibacterium sp. sgz500922 TaxID=3446694 RepID=UPI003F677DF6